MTEVRLTMRGHAQKPTYHCRDCGWKRTTPPSGDVRIKGVTWFRTCPECRSTALECDNAGTLDALWDSLPEQRTTFEEVPLQSVVCIMVGATGEGEWIRLS